MSATTAVAAPKPIGLLQEVGTKVRELKPEDNPHPVTRDIRLFFNGMNKK